MKEKTKNLITNLKLLFFPTLYLALAVALSLSIYHAIKKNNYLSIYIEGRSMQPTLNKDAKDVQIVDDDGKVIGSKTINTEFGYVDQSNVAMSKLKKFDIVVTYYPNDYVDGKLIKGADYKIKRVIALPGDTFKISQNVVSYKIDNEWVDAELPFERNIISGTPKDHVEQTLGENEYWVLGDNWSESRDSQSVGVIKKEYISGLLVAIHGTCSIVKKSGVDTFTEYNYYKKPVFYL